MIDQIQARIVDIDNQLIQVRKRADEQIAILTRQREALIGALPFVTPDVLQLIGKLRELGFIKTL